MNCMNVEKASISPLKMNYNNLNVIDKTKFNFMMLDKRKVIIDIIFLHFKLLR